MKNLITGIEKNSISEELEILPGDFLISIDNKEIVDIFDYRYLTKSEYLEILIEKSSGEEIIFEIDKDEDEDLGIIFENGIMDNAKSCKNKCIFCFIDQLPKNMRKTLYFKDDDSRLSFLQGNYITLTNMKPKDLDRIIFYHLSPINISVHATDEKLRLFMLKNPNSNNLISYIKKLFDSNIDMNFQVVLCKNINDKENLEKTINDLSVFIGRGKSLSIVPAGLTKYRNGLFELEIFNKEDAISLISQVERHQAKFLKMNNTRFVYVSDEFYIKAEIPLPDYKFYEDFYQIENGVGMISSMEYEFSSHIKSIKKKNIKRNVTVITGVLASLFIKDLASRLMQKFSDLHINVVVVENKFFGEKITVSGLLTGQDIINNLLNTSLGDIILIPQNALRNNDVVFLDDISIYDIEKQFKIKVVPCPTNGKDFIENILGGN